MKTKYAQVGLGIRSWMFSIAVVNQYAEHCELVGLCDRNAGRLSQRLDWARANRCDATGFDAGDFEAMIASCSPDCVIVTTPDLHHADYICRSMELGCDVISEKPLTIDAPSCQRILDTQRETGRRCRVTFNYRYSPPRMQVKELLASGAIGEIRSVDFHWLLDTRHGADYFRRWHRNKANSGGLLVHKATHHFDLVNWWLDSVPDRVAASGGRSYYTGAQADALGLSARSERCLDCESSSACPFHLDLREDKVLKAFYLDFEHFDGYFRDRCVFSDAIDIEDTMNVLVDYRCGTRMAYSLNAFMPREGYTISFNGSKGRLDHTCEESSYVSGSTAVPGRLDRDSTSIRVAPHFAPAYPVEVREAEGGHGGGDVRLLDDLFLPNAEPDPYGRAADHRAGAWSILTGIAANQSIASGQQVAVRKLVNGLD